MHSVASWLTNRSMSAAAPRARIYHRGCNAGSRRLHGFGVATSKFGQISVCVRGSVVAPTGATMPACPGAMKWTLPVTTSSSRTTTPCSSPTRAGARVDRRGALRDAVPEYQTPGHLGPPVSADWRLVAGPSRRAHVLCPARRPVLEIRCRRTRSLYVSNERAQELLGGQYVTGAPDIVVEIGSPGTRKCDETIKRRLYDRGGVGEYWVVDPDTDVIRVYRRDGGGFGRAVELTHETGDVLMTPLLPGLDISLTRVFPD